MVIDSTKIRIPSCGGLTAFHLLLPQPQPGAPNNARVTEYDFLPNRWYQSLRNPGLKPVDYMYYNIYQGNYSICMCQGNI